MGRITVRALWASMERKWHKACQQMDFPGGSVVNNSRVGKIPWRRKWQPIPVVLPGKSHCQRSLVGYSPWGRKEWKCLHNSTITTEVNKQFEATHYLSLFVEDVQRSFMGKSNPRVRLGYLGGWRQKTMSKAAGRETRVLRKEAGNLWLS